MKLRQCRETAAIALDCDYAGASLEQRSCQAAGPGADFINCPALEWARDGRDPGEQLTVEDEILPERLARAEPMAGNDVAERLGQSTHAEAARCAAHSAAMRIAAAIGRGSARSWPAMSNAVP